MKKMLILFLTVLLICSATTVVVAAAENANVYLDYIVGGSSSFTLDNEDTLDNSGLIVGGEYLFQDWKFGLEYGSGQMKEKISGEQTDFDFYDLRLGYKLLERNNWGLYLSSSVLTSKYDHEDLQVPTNLKNYAVVIGPEIYYKLNKKLAVQGFAGYTVVASITLDGLDEDSKLVTVGLTDGTVTIMRLDLNYLLTNQIGLNLGYRSQQSSAKFMNGVKINNSFDLTTLGITYRF